jgi:hypothetical protein
LVLNLEDVLLELGELKELVLKVLKSRIVGVELSQHVIDSVLPEPVILGEVIKESHDSSSGSLNRTSQKKDDLNDFLISGNPGIERISFGLGLVLLAPVLDVLGGLQNMGSSSVNGSLNLIKSRLKSALLVIKLNIDLEEGLQDKLGHVPSTADSLLHLVKRVLGSVEESLIHGPVVVLGQLLDFLGGNRLNMLIELVRADSLDEILYSSLNLEVLGLELLGLFLDPLLLHLDELIKSEGLGILGKVDQDSLGERFEVVLNTVLHDIIDVNNQLFKLGEALMNVIEITIDVHGSPGEGNHTGSEFVLEIFQVRHKKRLGVGSDLVDDSVVLSEDELELVLVGLELILLQQDDLGRLRDINGTNSREALSFSDEGHDLRVEVDIQLVVLRMSDDKGSLEASLGTINLGGPFLPPEILIGEEGVTNFVVGLDKLLGASKLDDVWRELFHGNRNPIEQMS